MKSRQDSKRCMVCDKLFFRMGFPRSFDRMVTCGDIDCVGKESIAYGKQDTKIS